MPKESESSRWSRAFFVTHPSCAEIIGSDARLSPCRTGAPKIGGATAADGTTIEADFQLAGGPSVLFDAVYVSLSDAGAKMLSTEAAAVAWVHDAFAHLKVIGAFTQSQSLLDAAGVIADRGVLPGKDVAAYLTAAANGWIYDTEPNVRTIY